MFKSIILGSTILGFVLLLIVMLMQHIFTEQNFNLNQNETSKIVYLTNRTYELMNETQSFVGYAKTNIDGINANPQQTEGLDLLSIVGRVATAIVKFFVAIYEIPIKYIYLFFEVLGLAEIGALIIGFITTYVLGLMMIVILSIFTRYPLDY